MSVVIYPTCNSIVAHLPGVIGAVSRTARMGVGKASAKLASHRDTGASRITFSHGRVDSFVSLDDTRGDRAAWRINVETGALDAAF